MPDQPFPGHDYTPAPWSDLAECHYWVAATLLQIERFVDELIDCAEAGNEGPSSLSVKVSMDGHFLLIAAAQVERSLKLAGRELPRERADALRSLRDVFEHWEQHKASFANPKFPKSRSGERFASQFPDAIPWAFGFDATGTHISELRLEELWEELLSIEAELETRLRELLAEGGLTPPDPVADPARPFPRRDSRVLGYAMVTQDQVITFD